MITHGKFSPTLEASVGFIDYAELKTRVSIHDAIQKLVLELKPAGHQLRGFCPQCKAGGDRALVITPDKSLFYCFNAKLGGDQIALVAHLKELTTNEAANWLAGTVPQNNKTKTGSTTSPPAPPAKVGFDPEKYAERLDHSHAALEPLGLAPETLQAFKAGYRTFLNGALVSNIVIDTSQVATDTVDYVATDNDGLTSTTTRTVVIEAALPANASPVAATSTPQ
jgi:DNA primase